MTARLTPEREAAIRDYVRRTDVLMPIEADEAIHDLLAELGAVRADLALVGAQLEWMVAAVRGEEVSDFGQSFAPVRDAADLRRERDELRAAAAALDPVRAPTLTSTIPPRPALVRLLDPSGPIVPFECCDCPFASNPQDVNISDPGEGYYDCALMDLEKVWGEDPKCAEADWRRRAAQEAAAPTITPEQAAALLGWLAGLRVLVPSPSEECATSIDAHPVAREVLQALERLAAGATGGSGKVE